MWKIVLCNLAVISFFALMIMGMVYHNGCMFWTGLIVFHLFIRILKYIGKKQGKEIF